MSSTSKTGNIGATVPPAYPPYNSPQPYQQLPVEPSYGVAGDQGGPAPEVQHHENNSSIFNCMRGEEEEKKEEKEDELLPGSGPGGVPQKYFNLDFESFFKEDKDTKTFRELYKILGLFYKLIKLIVYHFFVILLGIPMAIIWAILNGITIFVLVWIWAPALRLTIVSIYAAAPAATVPIQAILGPLFDVVARVFRQIRVRGDLSGNLGLNGIRVTGQEHIV